MERRQSVKPRGPEIRGASEAPIQSGTMEPAEQAREAFIAGVDLCRSASEPLFLLRVRRLVEITRADPLLNRCRQEAMDHADRRVAELNQRDAALRGELRTLRAQLEQEFPFLTPAAGLKPEDPNYDESLTDFDDLDSGRVPQAVPADPGQDGWLTAQLADILVVLSQKAKGKQPDSLEAKAANRRARTLRRRRAMLFLDQQDLANGEAGSAWYLVDLGLSQMRPPEIDVETMDPVELTRLIFHRSPVLETIRMVMYRSGSSPAFGDVPSPQQVQGFKVLRGLTEERLQLLKADVLWRLNTKVSREWVIRRYVDRCVRLRAEELRQLIRNQKGKPEQTLVADAAAYFFDQGLDVWTEVTLGAQRLDLVGQPGPGAFVVEAKIYKTPAEGRKAVRDGLNQLYSYVSTLEPTLSTVEGFLLMYRLGGRKLDLPPSVVKNGRRFAIVQVELGTSKDTGRNAPPAMPVTPADIGTDSFGEPEATQAPPSQAHQPAAATAKHKTRSRSGITRKPARAPRARGR